MEAPATWEKIAVGILVLLLLFALRPGLKATLERSRRAEKDWAGLLLPVGAVVLFVLFLIAINR